MRTHIAIAIAASLFAVEASASSVIMIESGPAATSRSIIIVQAAPVSSVDVLKADQIIGVSRSVVAVGQPSVVSGERVAAISDNATPMVLRGGVFGGALPAPVVEPEPVKKLSRPAQRAKERAERRAIREAVRFGEPLPQEAETRTGENQPATAQDSGT